MPALPSSLLWQQLKAETGRRDSFPAPTGDSYDDTSLFLRCILPLTDKPGHSRTEGCKRRVTSVRLFVEEAICRNSLAIWLPARRNNWHAQPHANAERKTEVQSDETIWTISFNLPELLNLITFRYAKHSRLVFSALGWQALHVRFYLTIFIL